MFKAKILLIGPSESGKTVLANFLSDTVETVGGEYCPTQGVRILEFESQNEGSGDKSSTCEVELWDCAGDFKFESCWPALMKDSNGVVIVFNPDMPRHLTEVETWYSMFISSQGLQDSQCLLMAHHKPGSGVDNGRPNLASHLNRLPLSHSNLEEDPEDVRQGFRRTMTQHISRLCKGYLTKKESDGVLHLVTWPTQSPDLNPIEMVCDELDRRVKEMQPTSTQHMWELLQDCWKSIPGEAG